MNALTVGSLVFLALITKFYCESTSNPFKLEDTHLRAKEGSCVEIKCIVELSVHHDGAFWFWMKNSNWTKETGFTATIIYSTNNSLRPVSPDFANRVTYIGSPYSSWIQQGPSTLCSILICNLSKTDSGNYSFRYEGNFVDKWVTEKVNLTVEENPCPITFEKPLVMKEFDNITLKCSTLSSCPSYPLIQNLKDLSMKERGQEKKSTTHSFQVTWQDDGKQFSCQTADNNDRYLIQNVSLTVEYAPKDTLAKISSDTIKEGESVTLNCSASGRPQPSFSWFKQNEHIGVGAEWEIKSINDTQSGEYRCEAHNTHGNTTSKPVTVNVTYQPEVEVKMISPASFSSVVKQGDYVTLTCIVKRGNPQPHTFDWSRDWTRVGSGQTYVVESIQPENKGTYKCTATNPVGTGTSELQITVEYCPRNTIITAPYRAKVGHFLNFSCDTDAAPSPHIYSWYRYNKNRKTDSLLLWKSNTTEQNSLSLTVQRADEACYMCNATNSISTGNNSNEICIQVLYPPTKITLSMDTEVTEDELVTISCSVESFPLSFLTITRTSTSSPQSTETIVSGANNKTLQHTFSVTSAHSGSYTCNAKNSEGSDKSMPRKLVVKYRPKDVTVEPQPGLIVDENKTLTLRCRSQSFPAVTSVIWKKMTDGKSEIIRTWNISVSSVRASDSGRYSCEATNDIGTGKSEAAEVKVRYAPKHTNIMIAAEQQQPGGLRSVMLSCSSRSYPEVTQYSWYKKKEDGESDEKLSTHQNHTVNSQEAGVYYCIAKNEINERSSDTVELFANRGLMKALIVFSLLIILLIFVIAVFVYRHKRNKSSHQGTTNLRPCFGFLGWGNGARRRNQMNEPVMAGPFRSRDDLLQDQPCRPNAQRRRPHPDSTHAANINSVYCTVNLPAGKQGPSAQKPIRQQGRHTENDSLNYASLDFGNKNKQAKAQQDPVYAMVSKKKPPNEREQERLEDYENISVARTAKPPGPLSYDTDTSEDEVELSYSQVNFTANPGHRRAGRDSSSSDEDETQYSEVKIS